VSYFQPNNQQDPQGTISLSGASATWGSPKPAQRVLFATTTEFYFELVTPYRIYALRCDNADERAAWMAVFEASVATINS
jgi:hypothetical protein